MASYKLPSLAVSVAILLTTGAPAHAQTAVEQSTCSFGWMDAAQTRTGWVCTRVVSPTVPAQPPPPSEASGSSSPPRENTETGTTILRGGGGG